MKAIKKVIIISKIALPDIDGNIKIIKINRDNIKLCLKI